MTVQRARPGRVSLTQLLSAGSGDGGMVEKMGSWVVGHNLAGYMPEADTYAFSEWTEARDMFKAEAEEYADRDDESRQEMLPTDLDEARRQGYKVTSDGIDYGDDAPSMRATVDSILKDSPLIEFEPYGMIVNDESDRQVSFWLQWSDDREPDEE